MEPKEKAIELLDKMSAPIEGHKNIYYRQCALIAVDEIIESNPITFRIDNSIRLNKDYWQEVKQEIEKL